MSVKDYETNARSRAIVDDRLGFIAKAYDLRTVQGDGGTGEPTSTEIKAAGDGVEVAAGKEETQAHHPQSVQRVEKES